MIPRRAVLAFMPVAALGSALGALSCGCGYRPLRSGLAGTPRIRVEGATAHVPGGETTSLTDEAVRGARGELARWGALADSPRSPGSAREVDRLRIEIVRLDEASEGVAAIDAEGGAAIDAEGVALPRARGVRIRITARGTIAGPGGRYETRDVEASEIVAAPAFVSAGDALAWDAVRAGAVRAAARTVGALVAREVLGIP